MPGAMIVWYLMAAILHYLLRRRHYKTRVAVAVGTAVTRCPPRTDPYVRSLAHTALVSDGWRRNTTHRTPISHAIVLNCSLSRQQRACGTDHPYYLTKKRGHPRTRLGQSRILIRWTSTTISFPTQCSMEE